MSTIAGMLMDRYGIRSTFVANIVLIIPCLYLSLFLWRSKDKAEEGGGAGNEMPGKKGEAEMALLSDGGRGSRVPSVSDLLRSESAIVQPAHQHSDVIEGGDMGKGSVQLRQAAATLHQASQSGGDEEAGTRLTSSGSDELPFLLKLHRIFSRPESAVFFFTAVVMGIGFGIIEGYLFLMLKDLGATDILLGEQEGQTGSIVAIQPRSLTECCLLS